MEVYEYDEFGYPVSWSAGNGGTSYAGIAISAGVNRSAERCNIDLNAQSGTAGDGVQGPLYEEYPLGYGANGESLAGIQLYFPATDCFVVCNATSGDGGSAVIDDGMGGRQLFGLSQAGIDLAAALATRTDLEANAQSGEISEDSFIYSTSQFPLNNLYYWQQDAVVKLTRYSSYYSTYGNYTALTLTATTGDQSRLSSVQVEDGFTSISWDTPPTITEGATPDGDGNPSRVDATGSGSNGWYTGEPNGNGAPLDGYETPGSGGITLGRYWE